jgi:DegV family protein with EDD domain
MTKVAIVTDSTAYLPADLLKTLDINVIPLSIIWDNETFRDGIDMQPVDFYRRLSTAKTLPTTSQVTVPAMEELFKKLLDQGNDVLGIFLSSKFSGTFESATLAREHLSSAGAKIAVVDSLSTTMAMGWSVLAAAHAARAGGNLAECHRIAESARDQSGVLFVVDTLEFLRRGGRIGGAAALVGTALKIKPVLEMQNGRIESVEKIRTKGKALERLLELGIERIGSRTPVRLAISHGNAEAEANALLETARARLNPVESFSVPLSPVIGTHTGPGVVAFNYMTGITW